MITTIVSANAIVVKDDRQQDIVISKPPQRIVSLLPSLTETVCALGQDRKSTRLNSSHVSESRMPSSA